jgi:FAD/FMN-containing dehydrogenase/Fe-S oxidoreductase
MGRVITSLEAALRTAVPGGVDTSTRRRAEYSSDASNYRRVPRAVVFPRTADELSAAVAACAEHGVTVTMRGGGTSVGGSAIGEGVVVDCSRDFARVLEIDPERRVAVVEPGVVLDDLRAAAAPYGLTFGPDPSTHDRCTIGGMIGNNACGSRSLAWGRTSDNVESLDVLLSDGTRLTVGRGAVRPARGRGLEVYGALRGLASRNLSTIRTELGRFPRQASGYALEQLLPENGFHVARALVGSEGTCAVLLGATVRLVEQPRVQVLLVLGYPDLGVAADAVPQILPYGPLACEGIDEGLVAALRSRRGEVPAVRRLPDGGGWLFVEFGGATGEEAASRAKEAAAALVCGEHAAVDATVVTEPATRLALWRIREDGAGLGTRLPNGAEAWPGWEDAAVPVERLGSYLRGFRALLSRHGRRGVLYGHFGDGCLHVRIDFDFLTPQGVRDFRTFVTEAADLVAAHGGSLSGEHGDGQARSELLGRMYGPEVLRAFAEFKAIWDPGNLLGPGVLIEPRPLDADLRIDPARGGSGPETRFSLAADGGDLARAARRCVGVGRCRASAGGVMCPSYRATGDERDSTRGRARVLQEMLRGDLVVDGWRSEEVLDSLDLCLMCKGCRSDCPVEVDMATYKAEFLHHHYAGRLRPRSHYSMGWLPVWARYAAGAPWLANTLAPLLRRPAGLTSERALPAFAPRTFRRSARRRRPRGPGRPVVLWVDTFTNHFAPQVADAAAAVLEDAGFSVALPRRRVCCGITWVSTGQLGTARRVMRRSLYALDPLVEELGADVPVVGLEPSCTATLRSDLPELLPDDPRAAELAARVVTLAQLLDRDAPDWAPPRFEGPLLTQPHCHQHAVLGFAAERRLLDRIGLGDSVLDVGCCGLAGSFGFEREHYDVSVAVAESGLLPALRAAPDAAVLADGFSCRLQVEQLANRRALHLAELLAGGLSGGRGDRL